MRGSKYKNKPYLDTAGFDRKLEIYFDESPAEIGGSYSQFEREVIPATMVITKVVFLNKQTNDYGYPIIRRDITQSFFSKRFETLRNKVKFELKINT